MSDELIEVVATALASSGSQTDINQQRYNAKKAIQAYEDHLSEQGAWQDISTAPKNKDVLCFNEAVGVYQSRWDNGDFPMYRWGKQKGFWLPWPTEWKPLPEPPKAMITAYQDKGEKA